MRTIWTIGILLGGTTLGWWLEKGLGFENPAFFFVLGVATAGIALLSDST